jgi:hypothetical protein
LYRSPLVPPVAVNCGGEEKWNGVNITKTSGKIKEEIAVDAASV